MPVITTTSMQGVGSRAINMTILGASDTFVFDASASPILILSNITAGPLTPNIDGADSTVIPCAGVGDVDVSGGYDVASIAANDYAAIPLNTIDGYLSGVITVTAGDGIEASILEF
jgi:hypothetical protein